MQPWAAERHIPEQITDNVQSAEVAAESPGRSARNAEAPVQVGPAWASQVNAQVFSGAEPPPQRWRAKTAEVRPEVPGWYARSAEPVTEVGTRSAGAAESPTEVACRCSWTAEVRSYATIGSTGTIEAATQLGR